MKNRVDTKWYGNGKKKSEHNYNVGFCISLTSFLKISFNVKENGLETHCYESRQKQEEITYKDGKEDGLNSGWYENGQKDWEGTYKDGEEDGLFTFWYENGQKKEETTFKCGKEISEKEWNEDGSLKN